MLQPGSCLLEPLDQVIAGAENEYNTATPNGTNAQPVKSSPSYLHITSQHARSNFSSKIGLTRIELTRIGSRRSEVSMNKLRPLCGAAALTFLLSAVSLLAQSTSATAPAGGTIATPPRTPRARSVQQQPCWQQAGISQSAMQQRRQIEESTRSQVQSVCSDSSLSSQQKREKIRQLREQARQQVEGLVSASQQQALRACQQERAGARGGHVGGAHPGGGGMDPCGELASGKATPQPTVPEPAPEPEQK